MNEQARSLRTFIGSEDFAVSREFYNALEFSEVELSDQMCYFRVNQTFGFYLQNYYVADWVNNTMMFLEVDDVEASFDWVRSLDLPSRFPTVRLSEIKDDHWGREFFLHDPAGVLWHIGVFADPSS